MRLANFGAWFSLLRSILSLSRKVIPQESEHAIDPAQIFLFADIILEWLIRLNGFSLQCLVPWMNHILLYDGQNSDCGFV